MDDRARFGLGLRPGDAHYRAYVGPPEDFDVIAGIQFALLFAAGLRETHRLVDVGCGSLRAGRLLIPYLRPGNYYGIEPNRWLVRKGLRHELGRSIVRVKRPSFAFSADFQVASFGVSFDFALAQSVFSHTYPDLAQTGLKRIARALAPDGRLFATFVEGDGDTSGSGWLYPGCVEYTWEHMSGMLAGAGMVGRRLRWAHPRQTWFVAAASPLEAALEEFAGRLRPPVAGS